MTPQIHTEHIERLPSQEAAMHAHTGKRLTTRITAHVQEKLQVAADLVGATLNQFVVQAALEKAEKVIESESTIVLTRRESLMLLEMIENPPPRNEKFLQAQSRYQRMKNDAGSTTEQPA
ncbi:MAG: type II toxin-antitoxin system TacA family antitoxin [Halothiobacillus sp.]